VPLEAVAKAAGQLWVLLMAAEEAEVHLVALSCCHYLAVLVA
jgi:hypothetical protein